MATINKKRMQTAQQFGGVPYGNRTVLPFSLVTLANGSAVDSDSVAAIGLGDKVRLGILPAGLRLEEGLFIVSDAFTAAVTGKIGFEYVDGVDSSDVPQDDDYFGAAFALNAAGRYRANNTAVRPVTLPKDAYLILTTAGAANASVGVLDALIEGVLVGAA